MSWTCIVKKAFVQKNIFKLGLYIALFPQLIAGPIVRYVDVCNEIESREDNLSKIYGYKRLILGLGKKVLIANTVGSVADKIFNYNISLLGSSVLWLGIICYALQIYFDFSGYSDMAIGLGELLGFHFLENFNYPYTSKSITEFWRKWHISLSSWFRDYLYIPLGGNRKGNVRTYINLLIVFMCTGFWHGSSWNFVIWGLFHGVFLMFEKTSLGSKLILRPSVEGLYLYTMLVVLIGWVFFRCETLGDAVCYLSGMIGFVKPSIEAYTLAYFLTPKLVVVLFVAIAVAYNTRQKLCTIKINSKLAWGFSFIGVSVIYILSLISVVTATYNPFIYFRF